MKNWLACAALLPLTMLWSCAKSSFPTDKKDTGTLSINLNLDDQVTYITRGGTPDLADFIVEIWNDTQIVEELNPVGSANAEIDLPEGDYMAVVYSDSFDAPAFESPVYGTSQTISIVSGQDATANLTCKQTNAGVRIVYDPAFQAAYTTYAVSVSQGDKTLHYTGGYAGSTGYFLPGDITVTVTADGYSGTTTYTLFPCRLYTLAIKNMPTPNGNLGIGLGVNTDVEEEDLDFFFSPEGGAGGDPEPPEPPVSTFYSENFGNLYAGEDIALSSYTGWETSGPAWSGAVVVTRPETVSAGYAFASGGNAIGFAGTGRTLQVTGINASSVTTPLRLQFALWGNGGGTIQASELQLSVDRGTGTPIGMDYALTPGSNGWAVAEIILQPPFSALALTFTNQRAGIYLDDVRLTKVE